jgi:hypothetical protein
VNFLRSPKPIKRNRGVTSNAMACNNDWSPKCRVEFFCHGCSLYLSMFPFEFTGKVEVVLVDIKGMINKKIDDVQAFL